MEAMMGYAIQAPTSRKEVVIVIEAEKFISDKLKGIGDPSRAEMVTIPKVPERLLHISESDAYAPRIISIGPYHRGEKRLQAMEKHKLRYVQAILSRNEKHCLKDYIEEIEASAMQARSCYSESINLDDEQFVEMMLLDGCFIVEFLLRLEENVEDQLHSMIWMVPQIQYDILLLENQIPFFVLQRIFNLVTTKEGEAYPSFSLVKLALKVCKKFGVCKMFSGLEKTMPDLPESDSSVHHLLHLYYIFILYFKDLKSNTHSPNSSRGFSLLLGSKERPSLMGDNLTEAAPTDIEETEQNDGKKEEEMVAMIPSATVLKEAGIKFERKEVMGGSILDVEFDHGVMKIPPLLIDSFTMYQFRNLITFEQLCPNMRPIFTAYVLFLDYLVNTSKDVALLHDESIIEHLLGSDESVALLFNQLTRATFRPPRHYLSHIYRDVDTYCKIKRHRWRAALVHNYFNGPWAVLSVVAAVILLGLTLVQTYFAVYSYYWPPP